MHIKGRPKIREKTHRNKCKNEEIHLHIVIRNIFKSDVST